MFVVYIMYSASYNKYYTGSCANIDIRIKRHNAGYTRSTKYGIPWEIVHTEIFNTRTEAVRRERQIKSYKGGEAFKKLIKK